MSQTSALARCLNIADLRRRARLMLPRPIFDYMDGGAEDEWTMRRNTAGFDEIALVPRALASPGAATTGVEVLGAKLDWPLICAPTGASRFYHADGEAAVARAAAKAGVGYALSTMATTSLEEVKGEGNGPKIFQLYAFKDRGFTRALVDRAKAAKYDALCITVDAPTRGKREAELRSGMGVPLRLRASGYLSFALRPWWLISQAAKGPMSMANIAAFTGNDDIVAQTRFVGAQLNGATTWADVEEIATWWSGPFAVKGILSPEDAEEAHNRGATAVIVSNHGGRQLDGAPGAIDALPAISGSVGAKVEVILDGGVRRGVHVLKALESGADACMIGRPYLYGLAAGGQAGVERALAILKEEYAGSLRLFGGRRRNA